MIEEEKPPIKTFSKSQLAWMYETTTGTFRVWLKRAGIALSGPAKKHNLTPKEVKEVYEKIGPPCRW